MREGALGQRAHLERRESPDHASDRVQGQQGPLARTLRRGGRDRRLEHVRRCVPVQPGRRRVRRAQPRDGVGIELLVACEAVLERSQSLLSPPESEQRTAARKCLLRPVGPVAEMRNPVGQMGRRLGLPRHRLGPPEVEHHVRAHIPGRRLLEGPPQEAHRVERIGVAECHRSRHRQCLDRVPAVHPRRQQKVARHSFRGLALIGEDARGAQIRARALAVRERVLECVSHRGLREGEALARGEDAHVDQRVDDLVGFLRGDRREPACVAQLALGAEHRHRVQQAGSARVELRGAHRRPLGDPGDARPRARATAGAWPFWVSTSPNAVARASTMNGLPPLMRWISSAASCAAADSDALATRRAVPCAVSGSRRSGVVDGCRAISASRAGARRGGTAPAVRNTEIGSSLTRSVR